MVCLVLGNSHNFLTSIIGVILLLYVTYSLKTGYFHRKPSFTSLSEWGSIAVKVHKDECPSSYWGGNILTVLFAFVLFYTVISC